MVDEPGIPTTTTADTVIKCQDYPGKPGGVEIATRGSWNGRKIGLTGGDDGDRKDHNHAKIGVSTSGDVPYVVFGDMNQQGSLSGPNCGSSQNGCGGLFYVLTDKTLHDGVQTLIAGDTGPQ
jgi:hypothetical protein